MKIVKRHGKKERFDEKKLYASVYAATLTAGYNEKESEKLAQEIVKSVKTKINKEKVTSALIKKEVIAMLKKKHKGVAFLYETHLDVS